MNKKSFTLIELLVVIAIIGILSTLVIARFSNWNDNARIANTLQWSAGVHRTLGSNLVGHWDFNDGPGSATAKDLSGYNNHGTLIENPSWVDGVSGTGGHALEFNGTNTGVEINNFPLVFTDSITLSVWLYYYDDTRGIIFGNYDSLNAVNIEKTDRRLRFYWNRGERDAYSRENVLTLNKWSHVIAIRNKELNRFEFWVNGSFINTVDNSGSDIASTSQLFRIGRDNRTGATVTNGLIDDVRIYNTALTAEEISRIYAENRDKYLVELE